MSAKYLAWILLIKFIITDMIFIILFMFRTHYECI